MGQATSCLKSNSSDFFKAVKKGDYEAAQSQLQLDRTFLLSTTIKGWTALHFAAQQGDLKLLQELIQTLKTNSDELMRAHELKHPRSTALTATETFIHAIINHPNSRGQTPLMLACKYGFPNVVQQLIREGGDPLLHDRPFRKCCIHYAAIAGHADCLQVLLSHSTVVVSSTGPVVLNTVRVQDSTGQSQRYVDSRTAGGFSPLHLASYHGRVPAVKLLIDAGASLMATTFNMGTIQLLPCDVGCTPLHLAAMRGNEIAANAILDAHLQAMGTLGLEDGNQRLSWEGNDRLDPRMTRTMRSETPYRLALAFSHRQLATLLDPDLPIMWVLRPDEVDVPRGDRGPPPLSSIAAKALREYLVGWLDGLEKELEGEEAEKVAADTQDDAATSSDQKLQVYDPASPPPTQGYVDAPPSTSPSPTTPHLDPSTPLPSPFMSSPKPKPPSPFLHSHSLSADAATSSWTVSVGNMPNLLPLSLARDTATSTGASHPLPSSAATTSTDLQAISATSSGAPHPLPSSAATTSTDLQAISATSSGASHPLPSSAAITSTDLLAINVISTATSLATASTEARSVAHTASTGTKHIKDTSITSTDIKDATTTSTDAKCVTATSTDITDITATSTDALQDVSTTLTTNLNDTTLRPPLPPSPTNPPTPKGTPSLITPISDIQATSDISDTPLPPPAVSASTAHISQATPTPTPHPITPPTSTTPTPFAPTPSPSSPFDSSPSPPPQSPSRIKLHVTNFQSLPEEMMDEFSAPPSNLHPSPSAPQCVVDSFTDTDNAPHHEEPTTPQYYTSCWFVPRSRHAASNSETNMLRAGSLASPTTLEALLDPPTTTMRATPYLASRAAGRDARGTPIVLQSIPRGTILRIQAARSLNTVVRPLLSTVARTARKAPPPPPPSGMIKGWQVEGDMDDLDKECGICLDSPQQLAIKGCGHRLCVPCTRALCQDSDRPALCPFCRRCIGSFQRLSHTGDKCV